MNKNKKTKNKYKTERRIRRRRRGEEKRREITGEGGMINAVRGGKMETRCRSIR